MQIHMPKSEQQANVEAIQHAIKSKVREVEQAEKELRDLRAELRGLHEAIKAIGGETKEI